MCAKKIQQKCFKEMKRSEYYTIIVNSILDLSHKKQLIFVKDMFLKMIEYTWKNKIMKKKYTTNFIVDYEKKDKRWYCKQNRKIFDSMHFRFSTVEKFKGMIMRLIYLTNIMAWKVK